MNESMTDKEKAKWFDDFFKAQAKIKLPSPSRAGSQALLQIWIDAAVVSLYWTDERAFKKVIYNEIVNNIEFCFTKEEFKRVLAESENESCVDIGLNINGMGEVPRHR